MIPVIFVCTITVIKLPTAVGSIVGLVVGAAVGDSVGDIVGDIVGGVVGDGVVGEAVGAAMHSPPVHQELEQSSSALHTLPTLQLPPQVAPQSISLSPASITPFAQCQGVGAMVGAFVGLVVGLVVGPGVGLVVGLVVGGAEIHRSSSLMLT